MELWLIVGLLFGISIFQTVHDYAAIGWDILPRKGNWSGTVIGGILALTYMLGFLAEMWAWCVLIFMCVGYIYFYYI